MSSPSERYARFRRDQSYPALGEFRGLYSFELDEFQVRACRAVEDGHGVLVAAPTGSGKTVVGEFAVHLALHQGRKCFYTTPIKALSNQKYADLVARYGNDQVGLLTGDNSINGEAPIVVMTTEVLRNMIYAGSPTLIGLGSVVMDEVHYLADQFRGAVWEEIIIHLPESVSLISLSATVSNAEEFGDWLTQVRGDTVIVVEERRPVPLYQHVLVGNQLLDLFAPGTHEESTRVNPALERIGRQEARAARPGPRNGHGRGRQHAARRHRSRHWTPSRVDVVERLDREGLLPAIVFIFSRAGCDAAVAQCLGARLRLTDADEERTIRAYVEEACADIPDEDLEVLGYAEFAESLAYGVAAHHAGLLPSFKECVEELFSRGLIKVVFATETLALGINMPARSVVLERLTKWNGERHVEVTPGEYTQLTGRAGRRGIDVEGHGVVLWQPELDPRRVAGLASTRTYRLRSSFRPSYNMAVNLVRTDGRERSRRLLESSFAQFQADRAVAGLANELRRSEEGLEGYAESAQCDRGDFLEYARLRQRLAGAESSQARRRRADERQEVIESLEALRPGDVIDVPAGRYAGTAVVVDPGMRSNRDGPRPLVVTAERQARRLSVVDFPTPVAARGQMRLPRKLNPRNPQSRRDLASALRQKAEAMPPAVPRKTASSRGDENGAPDTQRLRRQLESHPCHSCPDREDHARWAERYLKLERDAADLRRRIDQRTGSIARQFDRVCEVLDELAYLDGETVTPDGQRLARLYNELDLVAAECLRRDVWNELTAPELAACLSGLVYEARNPDEAPPPRLPRGPIRDTAEIMTGIWSELERLERSHRVRFLRQPDFGFAWAAYRWARGAPLDQVLVEADFAAGDFVRAVKQLLDVIDQVADAAGAGDLRTTAREASDALRRGVVAYSSLATD
ncbi:MAG TPA: DEAD/DEAH box helicase [Nocardioidaceae bacterium]|nr:DEAD/DEAH box helicase [Nocardioidaceae bacterium]